MRQVEVLAPDLRAARAVVAARHAEVDLQLAEPVVAHLIHEAVQHRFRRLRVDAVLARRREVVRLVDVAWVLALRDAHLRRCNYKCTTAFGTQSRKLNVHHRKY